MSDATYLGTGYASFLMAVATQLNRWQHLCVFDLYSLQLIRI